jgi:hypothetical protein
LPAITIILPISREQHLLKVLASLELLECERDRTSLLAFDDGDADLFLTARNLVRYGHAGSGRQWSASAPNISLDAQDSVRFTEATSSSCSSNPFELVVRRSADHQQGEEDRNLSFATEAGVPYRRDCGTCPDKR